MQVPPLELNALLLERHDNAKEHAFTAEHSGFFTLFLWQVKC